ncbi:MAG: aldehyde dehydrogenase [Methanocalculus sp. MSAO_Arc2]|uniref:aldehyde dehydrogenase family protein n=1 Tax=Methanocalculus sp. MSAO_Arc2 TaxID=2293855 RepID=UPI000FF77D40|nr:MAG: aldehyde dehydrogenase [Methanocalculus sp. MSAO_Arc2]
MQMMIGDQFVESVTGKRVEIINPATCTPCGEVPSGGKDDVDIAVQVAQAAFPGWASIPSSKRGIILSRSADLIRREADRLALILTTEEGKPLYEAKDEVYGAAAVFEYYAGSVSHLLAGYTEQLPRYGYGMVQRKPLGVCGAIIPWNMPVLIAAWKIGAALATGNTLVLKPSMMAPMAVLALGEAIQRSGLPPGVLNIITGYGEDAGNPLVMHPDVQKISFTGGIETGRQVAAAATMKRVTLELGGNDAMIICSDVDPVAVADAALALRMYNCGQICTSPKRMIVLPEIYDAFISRLEQRLPDVVAGDPTSSSSMIGPLNNTQVLAGVRDAVMQLADEGARIVEGSLPDGVHDAGFFHPPVLATGCAGDSKVLGEEIFGPVIPVICADDLDDAIDIANNTRYGLGASIWTRDMKAGRTAAEELVAGIVWINQHMKLPPEVPFGGVKESGIGRENGMSYIEAYTEEKTILVAR